MSLSVPAAVKRHWHNGQWLAASASAGTVGLVLVFATVRQPLLIRALFALLILSALFVLSVHHVRAALIATFGYLAVVALLRRLLIPVSDWTSFDPLLLVAPAVAAILVHRSYLLERTRLPADVLSLLVIALGLVVVAEAFNPAAGGITVGLVGLLFVLAPLFWFFVGREFADSASVVALLVVLSVLAIPIAIYGMLQATAGMPSWDSTWLEATQPQYGSLGVSGGGLPGETRPFGSFSSASEYATYVGVAIVASWVAITHRRIYALLLLPLFAYALLLASVRGTVVLALTAIVVSVATRTRNGIFTALTAISSLVLALISIRLLGSQATSAAIGTANPLVAHQVQGLIDPFNPDVSTLQIHISLAVAGVVQGITHPLGQGTGVLGIASQKLGTGDLASSEVDVSNAFLALGIVGGVLFLLVLLFAVWRGVQLCLERRDAAPALVMGVLIVAGGQWLNGGQYLIAPLVWFSVGWIAREWASRPAAHTTLVASPGGTTASPAASHS